MVAGAPDTTASAGGPADQGEQPWRRAFHSLGVIVAVLAVYYAVPVGEEWSANAEAFAVAVLVVGMALLAWQIVRQVRRQITAGDDTGVRVQSLLTLVYLLIVVFALGYFMLAEADAEQFRELETKTDALYFTMATLGTVGYGDVHASGQLARGLVALQIAFNLVFLGLLASVITAQLRQRAVEMRDTRTVDDPGDST
jgi:voltage-gated potassium channel